MVKMVPFVADVENEIGDLSYEWDFGDGTSRVTSVANVSHRFVGNDEEFAVILNRDRQRNESESLQRGSRHGRQGEKEAAQGAQAETPGRIQAAATMVVMTPAMAPATAMEPEPEPGPGPGLAAGQAGPGAQIPRRPKGRETCSRPGSTGQTVSGQLIPPGSHRDRGPAAKTPAAGNGESSPEAKPDGGGGGISKGAITAFGIGALLGLGGLAEAGALLVTDAFGSGPEAGERPET